MKKFMIVGALLLGFAVSGGSAEAQSRPGGCLKYGLGGAVAGHVAGGHRIKGALAGCALGIYQRRQYEREVRERAEQRNRSAERRRPPVQERTQQVERRQGPAPYRVPAPERTSPYEDLGLGQPSGRPNGGAQANRRAPQGRSGEFESEGTFLRPWGSDPSETGAIAPRPGKVY